MFFNTHLYLSGQGRIRTAEGASQQIYSLPVLTTYLPTRCTFKGYFAAFLLNCDAKVQLIFESAKQNLSFLSQ